MPSSSSRASSRPGSTPTGPGRADPPPAIQPGGADLKKVRFLVDRRRLASCQRPRLRARPFLPRPHAGRALLGVRCEVPTVRAEFDRVEIRELPPEGPSAAPGGTAGRPVDARSFLGKSYKVFPRKLSWHQAQQACREIGGHLTTPTSDQESAFLADLTAEQGLDSAWLGATDEKSEGNWVRVDGSPLGYAFWDQGQPNNKFNAEHYLILIVKGITSRGRWSDQPDTPLPASGNHGFACQWD